MDKETGKPIQNDGKDVTSTVAFSPDKAGGTQAVTFTLNGVDLGGHETVAFEKLEKDGQTVAVHTDIDDEGQTVKLTLPTRRSLPRKPQREPNRVLPRPVTSFP